jgi:hypothetical protein
MAYDYKTIIESNYEALRGDLARASGQLEQARLSEDADTTMASSREILEIRKSLRELDAIASDYTSQQQQQPRGNKFGLSPDEQDVAKISGISQEQYAANRQRMRVMKDQGYWSQGRVFK